jgi:protein-disulfide isomerase
MEMNDVSLTQKTLWIVLVITVATGLGGAAVAPAQVSPSKPLADVNGKAITEEEVDKAIAGQLSKLQEQIYDLRRQRLEAVIQERLLADEAKRRGMSVQKLLDTEVTAKVGLVTEEEVERFYQGNKSRLQAGTDEGQAREQIRSRLQSQKLAAQREAFVQSLRKAAKVTVHLQAPPVSRMDVSVDGGPVRGPANAAVTIVEFSDFHCPFCKRVNPTLKELEAKYGERVRIAFRDFPLDQLHPAARQAHEAARCAHEQGKFWAYHDVLFDKAPRASADDLKSYARQVGVDAAKFDQCLASGKYKEVVQKDVDEGRRLGISGTPAFFINGRLLSGAQPLDRFVQVIDEELQRNR